MTSDVTGTASLTCRELFESNGGDDGARTRDLRRDSFAFRANLIMELPVLSAACERHGPTRNAIECPKTIHSVHAYYTHIFIPEYLIRIIFRNLQLLHELPRNHRSRRRRPGQSALGRLHPQQLLASRLLSFESRPGHVQGTKRVPNPPVGSASETSRCFDGIEHTSACLRPRKYCRSDLGIFTNSPPGSDTRYHPIGSRLTSTRHARPTQSVWFSPEESRLRFRNETRCSLLSASPSITQRGANSLGIFFYLKLSSQWRSRPDRSQEREVREDLPALEQFRELG